MYLQNRNIHIVFQVRHSPTPALVLGISGLIPFVAAPLYMHYSGAFLPEIATAQLAYGASILSFLGGVRWGLTLPLGSTQVNTYIFLFILKWNFTQKFIITLLKFK